MKKLTFIAILLPLLSACGQYAVKQLVTSKLSDAELTCDDLPREYAEIEAKTQERKSHWGYSLPTDVAGVIHSEEQRRLVLDAIKADLNC